MKIKAILQMFIFCISSSATAKNSLYLSLESGFSKQENLFRAEEVNAESTQTKFPGTYRIGIGYNHDFFSCLGLGAEIAKGWYASQSYTYPNSVYSIRTNATEFLLALQFHIKRLDIIGKLGGLRQYIVVSNENSSKGKSHNNPEVGLTIAYNINHHFALTANYQHIDGPLYTPFENAPFGLPSQSINIYLFGIRYSFM